MPEPVSPRRFITEFQPGELLHDFIDPETGLRFLVTRGWFSFCAYVGVQADHALAGLEEFRFRCHWGVNYQAWGQADSPLAAGWYWWGWDYGHAGDVVSFMQGLPENISDEELAHIKRMEDLRNDTSSRSGLPPGKNWTLEEVVEDSFDVLMELRNGLKESEKFARLLHTAK